MGFQTPLYKLADYLKWTTAGEIQLPDFQRGYKWEEERIRQLLVTVLQSHPMGVVMLLKTGNEQIRFKPRPIEGVVLAHDTEPASLLLDGQQRLTSLTQALTGDGVVSTKDSRGKLMERRFYVDIKLALQGADRMDEAVISVPGDGVIRTNFSRDIVLDLSDEDKERAAGYFPFRLLYDPLGAATWLTKLPDMSLMPSFMAKVLSPAGTYDIPAIELDKDTSKSAVATVFEKVNTGGLTLNVFELLTATFAGDKDYYDQHGEDFRLNEDWLKTQEAFGPHSVLHTVENTDFLQAVTMLATLKRNQAETSDRPPAVSAKREDVLKLQLSEYLEWVQPLRVGFQWAATFLADLHIFDQRSVPYAKQLVPMATLRVVLGDDIDLHGVRERITQWYWCGVLGELYGSANETRFVRDLEQIPDWVRGKNAATVPRTIQDAAFVESRLHSLRTRGAAAYKGIHALVIADDAADWMYDRTFDKIQYVDMSVDIHHIFPHKWCLDHGIDEERRESIVNKTPLSAATNRKIGGTAPSKYLTAIEKAAHIPSDRLDALLSSHRCDPSAMRADDFDAFFAARREALVKLVEKAMGKTVQRDASEGDMQESADQFDAADEAIIPDEEESYGGGQS
ncbi:GmrSD restriction endonuclease domain-containing protein [Nonomuraea dietziae]|uniref:GmrSD restriction endonuclease domain-containing protein n=1 Tax=Nonomuraea dietziae TaxID=65515 RepID=UPI003420292E